MLDPGHIVPSGSSLLKSCSFASAMAKVSGTLAKSGEVMKTVNDLIKVPEMMRSMQELSKGGRSAFWLCSHSPRQAYTHITHASQAKNICTVQK